MKAVVFVDVQKDFVDGALGSEAAKETLPRIVEFAKYCKENGYRLYATRDTHDETKWKETGVCASTDEKLAYHREIECGYLATLEGQRLPVEHCIEGTEGWQIVPELMDVLVGNCTFINKRTFGSFDLAEVIDEDNEKHSPGVTEIVLVGYCTNICVVNNAMILRAKFPNKKITILQNLCVGTTEEKHKEALGAMDSCMIDIEDFVEVSI